MQAVTASYLEESATILERARDDEWLESVGLDRESLETYLNLQAAGDPAPAGESSAFSTPYKVAIAPSLLNTASVTIDAGTRWWEPGLTYVPDPCCSDGGTWVECPTDPLGAPLPPLAKPPPSCLGAPLLIKPFVAVTSLSCGMIGIPAYDEMYARTVQLHNRMVPNLIMEVLNHGGVSGLAPGSLGHNWNVDGVTGFTPNPYISATLPVGHDLTPASGAVPPRYGAQVLSAALSCCAPGQAGLIVGTPLGFETAVYGYGIRSGPTYVTPSGHYMIGSCGMDGRVPGAPDASTLPAGEQYLYAIGLPSIQMSPVWSQGEMARQRGQVASNGWPLNSLDPVTNRWTVMVESTIAATFNVCCRFAIRVNPGLATGN